MHKIISLYKSQKQKFWTHILLPFTYIFWSAIIMIFADAAIMALKGYYTDGIFMFVFMLIYGHIFPIILVIAIIEFFLKTKIKNKFILENKVYNVIWNTGNLLAFIFVMFLVFAYIQAQLSKYHII